MSDLTERYMADQRERELSEHTVERQYQAAVVMLWDIFDSPIRAVTAGRAQKLYDKRRAVGVSTTTHHNDLNQCKMLFRFAVKQGWLASSPFDSVEPVGKKKRGKKQLTIDQSRVFVSHCLSQLPNPRAIGALVAIGLGLRSGEILGLEPNDVDDRGRVLIVRGTKTEGSHRRLVIPEWLRPVVTPEALPLNLSRMQLLRGVQRLCRDADVPVVCVHGLRGTHASLASAAGAASEYVAASLGHSSVTVTERHYAQPGAVKSGEAERVREKLRLVK